MIKFFLILMAIHSVASASSSLSAKTYFAEVDLGLLAALGGTGINLGVSQGPWRVSLGYSAFKSNSEWGGTPEHFELEVKSIYAINVDYFLNGKTAHETYLRLIGHSKVQQVTYTPTNDSKQLSSNLIGMELGYLWKLTESVGFVPRFGYLYYTKRPQGTNNNPVPIGPGLYDNPKHKTTDLYITVSLGYDF